MGKHSKLVAITEQQHEVLGNFSSVIKHLTISQFIT